MQLITLLASTEDAAHSHSLIDALPHLAGMLMVMVSLTFLWGVCALTAKLVSIFLPEKKAAIPAPSAVKTPAPRVAAAPAPAAETGIAPEVVAVIAAAVATIAGKKPVRIVSIKPMSTSWERAGRHSVLTSHRIR